MMGLLTMRAVLAAAFLLLATQIASAALSLDTFGGSDQTSATTSMVLTYSTNQTNDIVCIAITTNGGPVISVSSTALGAMTQINLTNVSGAAAQQVGLWCIFSAAAQTNDQITVTVTTGSFTYGIAWGINGAATSSFVDNATLATVNTAAHLSITTNSSPTNEFVLGIYRLGNNFPTNGAGWSQIVGGAGPAGFTLVEYQIVSAPCAPCIATIGTGDTTQNAGVAAGICQAGITCNVVAGKIGPRTLIGVGQ